MHRIVLAFVFLLCLSAPPARAVEDIKPPFGLTWGVSKERMAESIKAANAKVVEKRIVNGREVWTVDGLIQTNLQHTVFYFRDNGLVEAELQYQSPAWLDAEYNTFLGQLRLSLESKFGPGKLIARSKTPQGDVIQTLTGYEWVQPGNAIQLIYFSAESPSQVFRMVSLHYKAM
ncbi:MAG: hypothetical protein PHQ12_07025 [Chthoniobacteraceae bacterium]|nr:hypothetical protein [Chthoniobacteraceae bacterium]